MKINIIALLAHARLDKRLRRNLAVIPVMDVIIFETTHTTF